MSKSRKSARPQLTQKSVALVGEFRLAAERIGPPATELDSAVRGLLAHRAVQRELTKARYHLARVAWTEPERKSTRALSGTESWGSIAASSDCVVLQTSPQPSTDSNP